MATKNCFEKNLQTVKFGDRMTLLAISSDKLDFHEISDKKVECGLISDAEHIFKDTFSR